MLERQNPHFTLVFSLLVTVIYTVSCQGASLTFVIDNTHSMAGDIALINKTIMNIVFEEKSSQFSNIVLVTFNDHANPELKIITSNRDEFQRALAEVSLDRGGDCAELALSGVKLGLVSSLPGSRIYVFTDASAKDYHMNEEILQLCQRKQSQIVFMLTGDCGYPKLQNFTVYNKISTANSGMAIMIKMVDIKEVLGNLLKEDIKDFKTGLTTKLTPANVKTKVTFWIDDLTKYVIVSASGTEVRLMKFKGPSLKINNVIFTNNAKVLKLLNSKPGVYKFFVTSKSDTSVVITGRSDFYFRHGFLEQQPKSLDDTAPQPFVGTLTYLAILVTDENDTVRIQSAQILDMNENVIYEKPLKELWPNFYTTEPFVAPSGIFIVTIKGIVIQTGNRVRRTAKIPVTPQMPPTGTPIAKSPVLEIKEGATIEVGRGSPVILTCKVSAYPAPEITWRNELGIILQSNSSRVQSPYEYISYLEIPRASEAKYKCHAKNALNEKHKAIDVIIKDPLIIKAVPKGTTQITRGTESTLNCDVRSGQPLQVRWYHDNKLAGVTEYVISSDKYSISSDGRQLKILSMDVDLVGKYTCKVFLRRDPKQKREFSTNVEINVPPKISPETQTMKVRENMPATIECKILEGLPKPELSWQMKAAGSSEYRSIAGSSTQMRIEKVALADGGLFKCIANNVAGHREQVVAELVVLKAPVVTIEEGKSMNVSYGSRMNLTCRVTANPDPTVMWKDSAGNTLTDKSAAAKSDFEYSHTITRDNVKASGKYTCSAKNYLGSASENVQVSVSSPFNVHSYPPRSISGKYETEVNLKCDITSYLPMKIRWYRINVLTNEKIEIETSKQYTILSNGVELKINSMDVDLHGKYACQAYLLEDPNEQVEYTTHVRIYGLVPPKMNPVTQTIEVKEHTPANIKCKILEGLPKPEISWQMKAAGSSEYRSIAGSSTELRIEKANLADSGHYKCIAENMAGRSEQVVAELVVLKAPVVTIVQGASTNVSYGSRMNLTCRVTANPEPTVMWKDSAGNTLPDKSAAAKSDFEYSHTIIRDNVKASGKYTCSAKNDYGAASESVQVSVSSPFNVHSYPPRSISGKYETEVNLKCDITSYLPMKIRWYRINVLTNEKIEIETSKQYTILSNGVDLKINLMDIDLDGKYTCKASLIEDPNEYVEYTTQVQTDGLEGPKITGDEDQKVRVGASVSIKCNVVKGVPKPKLSWQFKHTISGQYVHINNTGNVWYISNVTLDHSGFYKCTAKNSKGTSEHIVALTVEEPARIISEEFTVYEGIVGDIALKIPCETVGFPKPTIEWKVNGSAVTPGTKYVIEDGALVIKYPERSDSNYTCTATNAAGSDSKTFRGIVDDTFTDYGTLHDVYILKGDSTKLICSISRSDLSSVKWFIEPQNIIHNDTPYVTVKNANVNDDGNYTCHVSDIYGSATETFVVDVGYPPTFKPSPQGSVVEWSGDTEDVLSCGVHAKPDANVEWTFNGEPLVGSIDLNIFKWGHYKCNVSNVHGAVQKEFEVKPTVCLISRKGKDISHMPLMLTEELTWPKLPTSGEYMIMKPGDNLMLSCYNHEKSPNSFQKFPALGELEATCDSGDTFIVDGKPYELKDLQCTNEIHPSVVKTNSKCLTETSELMRVGYNLGQFVEAYEVCFDYARNIPLYTRVLMSHTNNVPSALNKWFRYPEIGNGRAEAYTCETSSSSCCYAKTQLASATDFSYGAAQNSSFIYPLNAIPVWRPCDSDRTTWDKLEDSVRALLDINPDPIIVWSGVHTLQEDKNGAITPRHLWKVVREGDDVSIAIVYVNAATPTADDIKCDNICAGGDGTWYSTSDKYTYCCTVSEFLDAFDIPGELVGESVVTEEVPKDERT